MVHLTVPREVHQYKGRSRSRSAPTFPALDCGSRPRTPERRRDVENLQSEQVSHQYLIRMLMPVDDPVFRHVNDRLRRQAVVGMLGPGAQQVAPLGHRVGGVFETLADSLAQGAIGFLDPVAGAATDGLDRSNQGHFCSLTGVSRTVIGQSTG